MAFEMSGKQEKFTREKEEQGKREEERMTEPTEVEESAGSPVFPEVADISGEVPVEPSVDEKSEIEKYRREAEEYKDSWLRAAAELDNYRKRAAREKEELIRRGNENVLREMISVMDNLERAFNHAHDSENAGTILDGIHRIMDQFSSALKKFGVEPIQAKGSQFDPHLHEAVMQVESRDLPPNAVVEELEKGYLFNNRLLRPAKVSVAKSPGGPEDVE
ncbi:MAG: nucleotide exchange factor GrpE [Deltaproteobacteria bacterium]|nr:nucleotide exchange factor GrpE [Deltaproteobacteria bacterium]MBW2306381.1 nucleotide exchange factor GrpE [Deltaproteobacteria bacterium]